MRNSRLPYTTLRLSCGYTSPKGRYDKRPLGIPIVKDRIVQQAFRQIIEPIFEKGFSDNSFGFRPDRCCHDAIKRLEQYKQEGYTSVLDADIMAFYDTIPHKLMDSLREKIADGWVLNSIENMLKAGSWRTASCTRQTKALRKEASFPFACKPYR
ncbi:MAG: hypothetical protein HS127_15605 [Planctomycetia bacterium]|nr:hypothetical protein [Planctomycetia bacterium]